jgi:hypothetical protein
VESKESLGSITFPSFPHLTTLFARLPQFTFKDQSLPSLQKELFHYFPKNADEKVDSISLNRIRNWFHNDCWRKCITHD